MGFLRNPLLVLFLPGVSLAEHFLAIRLQKELEMRTKCQKVVWDRGWTCWQFLSLLLSELKTNGHPDRKQIAGWTVAQRKHNFLCRTHSWGSSACKLRLKLFVWLGLYQVSGGVPLPLESTELNKGNFWNRLLEYWDKCYCFCGESHNFFKVR